MEKIKDVVREMFTEYLQEKAYRKTPERYAILEEIYSHAGHFDVESLYENMCNKKYRVSRATIYNTIELLLECNLIVKHQFKNNIAQFERAYSSRRHEHLICVKCGRVEEFSDSRLNNVVEYVGKKHDFMVRNHMLYVYGICHYCQAKIAMSEEKKRQQEEDV